jgi:3-hydroxy-D-aspartate aldolase
VLTAAFEPAAVADIESPALVIDINALDRNLQLVSKFFRSSHSKLRPHVKCHKSVALAKRQIAAGGTVGGVCVAKVSEAEVMVAGGIADVMIANEVVSVAKVERLAALAHLARISVFTDSEANVALLSRVAREVGVVINVLVDVDTRIHRCGVSTVDEAVSLAFSIDAAPGLRFSGVNGYEGTIQIVPRDARSAVSEAAISRAIESAQAIRAGGLEVETVTAGGTSTWDIAGSMPSVTEVQAGGYLFRDADHAYLNPEFRTSLFVLATVLATPEADLAIVDVGADHLSTTYGPPIPESPRGLVIKRVEPQFMWVGLGGAHLSVGDRVVLVPAQCDMAINRFGSFFVIEGASLIDRWKIDARAHSQ